MTPDNLKRRERFDRIPARFLSVFDRSSSRWTTRRTPLPSLYPNSLARSAIRSPPSLARTQMRTRLSDCPPRDARRDNSAASKTLLVGDVGSETTLRVVALISCWVRHGGKCIRNLRPLITRKVLRPTGSFPPRNKASSSSASGSDSFSRNYFSNYYAPDIIAQSSNFHLTLHPRKPVVSKGRGDRAERQCRRSCRRRRT